MDLKTIASATALLLLIPVGLASMGPDQLIIEGGADQVGDISDIVLADLSPFSYANNSTLASERLVEGHTVFVTIDIVRDVIVNNGSVDITGFARCDLHANATGPVFFGVVVPNRIHQAHEECHVGDRVIVTPDPFNAGTMSFPQPTGVVHTFTAPNGEPGYAEEFAYTLTGFDLGTNMPTQTVRYAWAVPVLDTWTDAHGRTMDFFAPLPNDRLWEMNAGDFQVVLEKNFPHG